MRSNITGRKKKVLINVGASVASEVVTMICGLILPRLILSHFGSSYNGIINSITQMISFVTLLRAGVGGVTRAALYKPLANGDTERISSIVNATERFMRKIARIFLAVMIGMAAIYPFIVRDFDWLFSFTLFIILGLSTFIQYYFGITYQMLLLADQRNYIYTFINIISIIINTVLGSILIICGCEIRIVKMASAFAFALTPLMLNLYVKRTYHLNKKAIPDTAALSQRWDALGHQVAYYVLTSTDLTVLTIFSNVKYVSVYSVYYLVIKAIKTIIKTYSSSIEAAFGNVMAKDQQKILYQSASIFECFMCLSSALIFACTVVLIVPFVEVYTSNVTDINYIRPIFAIILILGELMYCIRIPYMSLVEAAGMYKQTKKGAYIEAMVNILSSIILVVTVDPLIGVATGTLLAMTERTIEISRFVDLNILKRSRVYFYRVLFVCALIIGASYGLSIMASKLLVCNSYVDWIIRAVVTFIAVTLLTTIVSFTFYRKTTIETLKVLLSMIRIKRKR